MNILEEVQCYVADKLNADPQLSACPFLVENRKDIDFEIKQALGKQGVVGLVMTPKATYAGAYMDVGIAWQIDELEIDVVENVTVNRGKKDNDFITGQDAAMRLFDVLCPLSGDHEGQFSPVSYSEGEDNSLLVNKSVLKCLVHKVLIPAKTIVQFADGTSSTYDIKGPLELDWLGPGVYPGEVVDVQIGEEVTGLGERSFTGFSSLSSIVVPKNVTSISGEAFSWTGLRDVMFENGIIELSYGAFSYSQSLSSITLPNTLQKIGADVFEECYGLSSISVPKSVVDISRVAFRYSRLTELTMVGRTKAEVKAMENYSWGLQNGCVIHCTDGDIVIGSETVVQYKSGLVRDLDIEGQLTYHSIPSVIYAKDVVIGSAVTSIDDGAFEQCHDLTSVTIPGSINIIGDGAFLGCIALASAVISEGVETIDQGAFTNCKVLNNITIPSSVQNIGEGAFFSCEALYSITFSGKDRQTVQGMDKYPWQLQTGCVIHCTDGDITI